MDKFQVNREKLLTCLEAVSPALTAKDVTEQSSCFAFRRGWVFTYNDELSLRCRCPFPEEFAGAAHAKGLLDMLRRVSDELLTVSVVSDGHRHQLVFDGTGKRRRAGVLLDLTMQLDIGAVDKASEWRPLPPEFADAVAVVAPCAGNNESQFLSTCVHVHPKWVEACDDFQLCRWRMRTGVDKPYLVRHTALKHVVGLGATQFGFGPNWVHFRAKGGLQLSCRCYWDEYPDMTHHFKVEGTPTRLPKDLAEAIETATIFTRENPDSDYVQVDLKPGAIRLLGVGVYGWYTENRRLPGYKGCPLGFRVSPKILGHLVQKHDEFVLSADKLQIDAAAYRYVTSLIPVDIPKIEEKAGPQDAQ